MQSQPQAQGVPIQGGAAPSGGAIQKISEADIKLPPCINAKCVTRVTNVCSRILGPCLMITGGVNFAFSLFGGMISPPAQGQTVTIPYLWANILFSFYSIIFGLIIILSTFSWRAFLNNFTFLKSPFGRSMFFVFTGTLCMGTGPASPLTTHVISQILAYTVGAFVVAVGCIQIAAGCRKEPEPNEGGVPVAAVPVAGARPPMVGVGAVAPVSPVVIPTQPYAAPVDTSNPFDVPANNVVHAAQSDPQVRAQTTALMGAAGASVATSLVSGKSRDEAIAAAASNPDVQRAALSAATAAAQNPSVRAAATRAVAAGVESTLGNAYDKLFGA
ncbi:hypothetical protein PAPYR_11832 [Paratrimastix pyriformis]|uniref:Uncharacterized protein n=1 Tax=Paratrimastix pyriformis TaxID=342808 RepID=A0ABQ8UA02_9EUKA|nr:hypothetical protein PAPYR_11832 [Paratrimastix pyriformis]|eukprot:GAFH01002433.1.p1 GENE.GAFH01002433.1~~GAFH01002433.1.p1  ORF type:complete len:340 (+),score=9.87 GAFH01002433.1:32-1021(+)